MRSLLVLCLALIPAALFGQNTGPQNTQPTNTDPTTLNCSVGKGILVYVYNDAGTATQYTCGPSGKYIPTPGGSTSTLTASGVGASGAAGANKLTGTPNTLVGLDGSGNGIAYTPAQSNAITDASTTARQFAATFVATSVSGNPTVDGTPIANAIWSGTYSSGSAYNACNVVNFSGGNYIATNSVPIGTSPTTATGTFWWKVGGTTTLPGVTQLDCAVALAIGRWSASGVQQTLQLGSGGVYQTCTGLYLGSGSTVPYNLYGQGNSWSGGGSRLPGSTVQTMTGCPVIGMSHGAIANASGGAPNFHIKDILFDANNQGKCWEFYGLEGPRIDDLACINGNDSTHWAAIGNFDNPANFYSQVSDLIGTNIQVLSGGHAVSNWAKVTLSGSTGTPTLVSGGSYQYNAPLPYYKGFCTGTLPQYTVTMSGSGPYAVSSVTQTVAGVGCNTTNQFLLVPDLATVQYGLDLNAVDSRIDNLKTWGVGQIYSVRSGGSDFQMTYFHPVGSPIQFYDVGGALLDFPYFDSPVGYGADIHSNTRINNSQFYWNGAYPGASSFLFDNNSYGAQINDNTCGSNQQTTGGYSLFSNNSGQLNPSNGNAFINLNYGVAYRNDQSCDGTSQRFSAQAGSLLSGNTIATVPSQPATVTTATQNGGSVVSYTYCVTANNLDGTSSARQCGTGPGQSTPDMLTSWSGPPNNTPAPNSYTVTCAAGCTSTGIVAIVPGNLLTYEDKTGVPISATLTSSNPTGGRLCSVNGSVQMCLGANTAGTLLQMSPTNGTPNGFSIALANGAVSTPQYQTATNCSSAASPAVCGSAAAGKVQIAAAATTLTINSTAFSGNSECSFTYSTVGITAPTNLTSLGPITETAQTATTSLAISIPVAPLTNPINIKYSCVN